MCCGCLALVLGQHSGLELELEPVSSSTVSSSSWSSVWAQHGVRWCAFATPPCVFAFVFALSSSSSNNSSAGAGAGEQQLCWSWNLRAAVGAAGHRQGPCNGLVSGIRVQFCWPAAVRALGCADLGRPPGCRSGTGGNCRGWCVSQHAWGLPSTLCSEVGRPEVWACVQVGAGGSLLSVWQALSRWGIACGPFLLTAPLHLSGGGVHSVRAVCSLLSGPAKDLSFPSEAGSVAP